MDKKTTFFSRRNRWILMFAATIVIYFYLALGAYQGMNKNATAENKAAAVWLNPKANGYRKTLGDKSTPSLWDPKDPKEWVLLTITASLLPIIYYLMRKEKPEDSRWFTLMKAFTIWSNTALILLLLPINPFHKRFLYNFKVFLARVLEEPAKELFLAFVFIVLLPLPGAEKSTVAQRFTWLAIKMGLFYFVQTLLLGAPKYTLLPPDQEKSVYLTKKQAGYYGAIIAATVVAIVIEKYTAQKIEAS
jgi:hypothetical protein